MPWYSANNCSYRYRTEVDLDFCNMYIAVPQLIICTFNHLVSSRSAALLQAQPVPLVKPSYDCWPKALLEENQPNPESPPNIVSATTLELTRCQQRVCPCTCFGCCVTRIDFCHSQAPPAVAAARPRGIECLIGRAHSAPKVPKVRSARRWCIALDSLISCAQLQLVDAIASSAAD